MTIAPRLLMRPERPRTMPGDPAGVRAKHKRPMTQGIPTIVGHRGARGEAPENTLAGFQVALEAELNVLKVKRQ